MYVDVILCACGRSGARFVLTGRVAFLVPADHGEKLHDVPDEDLKEVMVDAKKIAVAQGLVDYNILQVST